MPDLEARLADLLEPSRVLADEASLAAYECDGFTVHRQRPRAVLLPESTEEVAAAVRLLAEAKVPFLPRGAGTCLSGGPTPAAPAVVIETARLKKVLRVDPDELLAVVQPGVVNMELSRHVSHLGLHYAPDPSSQSVCTIGGNLAENSGGPHCFKYGMTTDHVLGAQVVLATGEVVDLGGPSAPRAPGELDLIGVFTGSEGTFGIATEITVRLTPNPDDVRTLLASFADMATACAAVSDIVSAGLVPAAMEILDEATIAAVEASVYAAGYPVNAAAVLLVELDGEKGTVDADSSEIREFFAARGALQVDEAADPDERQRLWKGRKGAFGAMGRLKPDLYVLDGVVPRSRLEEALRRITDIGRRHGLTLTNVFHAGDGNLHPNISFDGRDDDERRRVLAAGEEILTVCMELGGSITGEHGVGSEKLDHVPMMFTPDDLAVMARVRRAFDPTGLCNPGKVLPERASCGEVSRLPGLVRRILDEEER